MMTAHCIECRDGDHADYDDDLCRCDVSGDGMVALRDVILCGEHRTALADDGAAVTVLGPGPAAVPGTVPRRGGPDGSSGPYDLSR